MKKNISKLIIRILKVILGFFIIGMGNALTLKANLGMNAWSTLDHGISMTTGITFGQAVILTGVGILVADILMGMVPGFGTILNMIFIGTFSDINSYLIRNLNFSSMPVRLIFLIVGLLLVGIGSGYYISVRLGTGPRDSFSILLSRNLKIEFVKMRVALEITAIALGFFLGATVGIGTILSGLFNGPIMARTMKFFDYNPATDLQENALETLKNLNIKDSKFN